MSRLQSFYSVASVGLTGILLNKFETTLRVRALSIVILFLCGYTQQ